MTNKCDCETNFIYVSRFFILIKYKKKLEKVVLLLLRSSHVFSNKKKKIKKGKVQEKRLFLVMFKLIN